MLIVILFLYSIITAMHFGAYCAKERYGRGYGFIVFGSLLWPVALFLYLLSGVLEYLSDLEVI